MPESSVNGGGILHNYIVGRKNRNASYALKLGVSGCNIRDSILSHSSNNYGIIREQAGADPFRLRTLHNPLFHRQQYDIQRQQPERVYPVIRKKLDFIRMFRKVFRTFIDLIYEQSLLPRLAEHEGVR
jgi:hypothetical protein